MYRHPLKKFVPPQKPELVPNEFDKLPEDQQLNLLETNENFRKNLEPKKLPVVGYTGFLKSIYAENMYGKTFKDLSVRSKQQ